MADAITSLPTQTDGSAGRVKSDLRPVASFLHYVLAAEWNTIVTWLVRAAAWLGLSDGSTDVSLLQLLRAITSPRATVHRSFDNFERGNAGDYATVLSGTGAASYPATTGAAEEGFGHLSVSVGAGAGDAEVRGNVQNVSPAHNPRIEFRFKTPASFTGADVRIGFRDAAGTSKAMLGWNSGSTALRYDVGSATGGGSDAGVTSVATTLLVSKWYRGRVEVDANSAVRVYLDDVLVHTASGATSKPRAGDTFSIMSWKVTYVSAATILLGDWRMNELTVL